MSRSKERVKKYGEVFTPSKLVEEMLNTLPESMWEEGRTFLDPTCGNGNFLVATLERKLKKGHNSSVSIRSVFGVDILPDNVKECRLRLLRTLSNFTEIKREDIKTVIQNVVWVSPDKFPRGTLDYDLKFRENQVLEEDLEKWIKWQETEDLPVSSVWPITDDNIFST